jgi:hypothetical protein
MNGGRGFTVSEEQWKCIEENFGLTMPWDLIARMVPTSGNPLGDIVRGFLVSLWLEAVFWIHKHSGGNCAGVIKTEKFKKYARVLDVMFSQRCGQQCNKCGGFTEYDTLAPDDPATCCPELLLKLKATEQPLQLVL